MKDLLLVFCMIVSGFKNEISNDIKIENNKIIIKFPNGTSAIVSLKINEKNEILKRVKRTISK